VVIIFEIILNATSMFNHGNVRFPAQIDRISRLVVVTPETYRVQHSVIIKELNSNFGFNLPWWDRFLGTSRPTWKGTRRHDHWSCPVSRCKYSDPSSAAHPFFHQKTEEKRWFEM